MHPRQPQWIPSRRLLLQIFVAALVARFAFMLAFQTWEFPDDWQFGQEIGKIGRSIAEGQGFELNGAPTAMFPPVYPYLVAGVFAVFGAHTIPSALVLFLFQSLCSGFAALCLTVLGGRFFNCGAGIVAGFAWACYPTSLFHSVSTIWYSELAILLVLVILVVATSTTPLALPRRMAMLGALSAVLLLTDSSMLVFVVVMLFWILWARHVRPRTAVGAIAIWIVVSGAVVSPWAARNWIVSGTPAILKSNFGLELFFGNNPYSSGGTLDGERRKALAVLNQTELAEQRARSERAYFGYLQTKAVEWIRLHPAKFLQLTLARCWNFWGRFPGEGPDLLRRHGWVHFLWWAPLVGIAAWGVARRVTWSLALAPAWLFLLVYPIPYYITHVQHFRYRYPVEPFIILLAAVPLSDWIGRAVSSQRFRAVVGSISLPALPRAPAELQPSTARRTDTSPRALVARAVPHLLPVLVLLAATVLLVLVSGRANDHFDRISRARQIAEYGEAPFRDFMDPGYFLTLYASAFMQKALGLNLLGEILLNTAAMAVGLVLAYVVAARVSRSRAIALAVTLVAVAASPRLYDYDKVLFYPLGIALCWLYARRPSSSRAAALAAGTALAGLFRYDSGLYIMSAGVVTLVIVHWRVWRDLGRAMATYALCLAVVVAPALVFVARHGGLVDAVAQVLTYAQREGSRTHAFRPDLVLDWRAPLLVVHEAEPEAPLVKIRWTAGVDDAARRVLESRHALARGRAEPEGHTWTYRLLNAGADHVAGIVSDPSIDDTAGLDRGTFQVSGLPESGWETWRRAWPFLRTDITLLGLGHEENAATWLYGLTMALPFLSVLLVGVRLRRHEWQGADPSVWTTMLAAAALCLLVDVIVLRDPIAARVGAVAVPSTILLAWVFARPPARERTPSGGPTGERRARFTRAAAGGLGLMGGLVVVVLTAQSLWTVGSWRSLLRPDGYLSGPFVAARKAQSYVRELQRDPPSLDLLPSSRLKGLVQYLRQCTTPEDRVMATWFAPELYFFSGRAFAGGMVVFFGDHWTELKYQRRIIQSLDAHTPPIVIVQTRAPDDFSKGYPFVYQFVERRYRLAAVVDFDNPDAGPDGYQVFVDRARSPSDTYGRWSLPCFGK